MTTRVARFAFLVLGLLAISALLVQPICEAAERHLAQAHSGSHATVPDGDQGDPCCSMTAPAALRTAAPLAKGSSVPVAGPTVRSLFFRPQIVIPGALASAAPPLVPRYYVRSARIQR